MSQEKKLTVPEGFAAPIRSSRGCTILRFLLLIANWVSLTALGWEEALARSLLSLGRPFVRSFVGSPLSSCAGSFGRRVVVRSCLVALPSPLDHTTPQPP